MQPCTVMATHNLFQDFGYIDSRVEIGPASALALTLREFLAILFSCNRKILYHIFQVVFGYMTYPIKFLDFFLVRNQFAFMIACSVYFVGVK